MIREYTAAVITVSDKGTQGLRQDTSGPALCGMLEEDGWRIVRAEIVPDVQKDIRDALLYCTDTLGVCLTVTTGGTGFSPRDVTPEATKSVLERETPGIPEAMRAESMRITPRGCLSRETAGIRRETLVINCPGSEKAARECLGAILPALRHGVDIIRGWTADCGEHHSVKQGGMDMARTDITKMDVSKADTAKTNTAKIVAVCLSEQKGTQKHEVPCVAMKAYHGIEGDAHAGSWHRQVSLLGMESVQKVQERIPFPLKPGDFAENVLTEGICLYTLPIGTRLRLGSDVVGEVTQIGKECHQDCAIRQASGICVMPQEGIFIRILQGGIVHPGDPLAILP